MFVYNKTANTVYSYNEPRIRTELEGDNQLFRINRTNRGTYVNPLVLNGDDIRYTMFTHESYRDASKQLLAEARKIWTDANVVEQEQETDQVPEPA